MEDSSNLTLTTCIFRPATSCYKNSTHLYMLPNLIRPLLLLLFVSACSPKTPDLVLTPEEHEREIELWYQERVESLKKEDGWLNLIGLHWMEQDTVEMGRNSKNTIVFDEGTFQESIGLIIRTDHGMFFFPQQDGIQVDGKDINRRPTLIYHEEENFQTPVVAFESFRWTIIKRGEAFGIRIRDLNATAVQSFTGIPRYPVSLEWRLEGTFTPYDPPKEIPITNIVGQTSMNASPGFVSFQKNGISYQLDALDGGEELFLILADASSGITTYGGGRYLYISKPKEKSQDIIIDFNKAYNPPCVFTAYATCPLPPRQNMLELTIEAGEQYLEK